MENLNIKIIPTCFEKSIIDNFNLQLQMTPKVAKIYSKQDEGHCKEINCISSVTFESGIFAGTLSLGFPKDTILKIVERMVGEPYTELTTENSDASGEMLNIIYSSARKTINETGGFDFKPALPATVIGQQLAVANSSLTGSAIFYDFNSDAGPFTVLVLLRKKQ